MNTPTRTIGDVAAILDIPTSTARDWVKNFQDTGAFSDAANPAPGRTRLFTDDDLRVMWTIYLMRAQRRTTDEIADALAAGERYEPQPDTPSGPRQTAQDAQDAPQAVEGDPSIGDAFSTALVALETRLTVMDDRIADLTDRLVEAEKRAAVAETELRMMRAAAQDATPTGSAPTDNTVDQDISQVSAQNETTAPVEDANQDQPTPASAAQIDEIDEWVDPVDTSTDQVDQDTARQSLRVRFGRWLMGG